MQLATSWQLRAALKGQHLRMVGAEGRGGVQSRCTCARRVRLLRYRRRRWRWVLALLAAAGLLLYDHFVLSRRSGGRLLPLFMLGLSCPPGAALLANMSLLDGRQEHLLAAAARNERVERHFRRRDGSAAIFFLHFHKAGNPLSLCLSLSPLFSLSLSYLHNPRLALLFFLHPSHPQTQTQR